MNNKTKDLETVIKQYNLLMRQMASLSSYVDEINLKLTVLLQYLSHDEEYEHKS